MAATGGTARHSLVLDYALRPLFNYLHAQPIGTGVFAATEDFASPELQQRIDRAAAELLGALGSGSLAHSNISSPRRLVEDHFASPVPFEELLAGLNG